MKFDAPVESAFSVQTAKGSFAYAQDVFQRAVA
jgi:hypothetical protein